MPKGPRAAQTPAERRASLAFYLGVGGMLVCLVVWLIFDRVSPVIFGGFGTLVGAAQGAELVSTLKAGPRRDRPEPGE